MKKIQRIARALERFTIMSFEEWCNKHSLISDNNGSLGSILTKQKYDAYVERKHKERSTLKSRVNAAQLVGAL
jgi:hypothetical protein